MLSRLLRSTSYISCIFGIACVLGVLGFHYPEYLTTPRLRDIYTEADLRLLLEIGIGIAITLGLAGLITKHRKRIAAAGIGCALIALMAGGADVPLDGPIRDARFYLSLDWLVLDLLIIGSLFITVELAFKLRTAQTIFRSGWDLDLKHYVANHLFNGGMIVLISLPATLLSGVFALQQVQEFNHGLPIIVQVVLIMLVTDFSQYWIHRSCHRWPLLWRFHRIHHSVETMDWLAGSRLHFVDILITRSLSLVPMVVLGFADQAINIYLPILALQSVFIHCNVNYPLDGVRKIIATPRFHHWHHTRGPKHLDKNFSVTFPLFDLLFGTYHCPKGAWPSSYGLEDKPFRDSYLSHLFVPFKPEQR